MKPTVHPAMPASEYRALPRLSASDAKALLRSPERWAWEREHPAEPSPSMRFGTLVHCCVLEPVTFGARYALRPEGIDRRTKDGKLAWEAFEATVHGREIIDGADLDRADTMRDTVAAELRNCGIVVGLTELSILFDLDDGTECKARIDALLPDGVLDLKTTSGDLDDDTLSRAVWSYRMDLSLSHYLDACAAAGLPCERAVLAFVQTAAPHCCRVVEVDHDALMRGRTDRDRAAKVYAQTIATGARDPWRGKVGKVGLPGWVRRVPADGDDGALQPDRESALKLLADAGLEIPT